MAGASVVVVRSSGNSIGVVTIKVYENIKL